MLRPTLTVGGGPPSPIRRAWSGSEAEAELSGRRVAFTTPQIYGRRLGHLLQQRGALPLHFPTIAIEIQQQHLLPFLLPGALDSFAALAFTSRSGISALSLALLHSSISTNPLPLSDSGHPFTVAALGSDADLLLLDGEDDEKEDAHGGLLLSKLCRNPRRIRILVPDIPTPAGLVQSLGSGVGRRVLCPAPSVLDLQEPPVVPDFISDLEAAGWLPVRVPAYVTRWAGPRCVEGLMGLETEPDAIVFTSSAEVEGLVKGLDALGWSWEEMRRGWPKMLVAAHGPVTAKGVERFGITVDVVSARFSSFNGVLDALAARFPTLD